MLVPKEKCYMDAMLYINSPIVIFIIETTSQPILTRKTQMQNAGKK